jgi:hypothetical protein
MGRRQAWIQVSRSDAERSSQGGFVVSKYKAAEEADYAAQAAAAESNRVFDLLCILLCEYIPELGC